MANNRNDNRGGDQDRERDSMGRFTDEDGGHLIAATRVQRPREAGEGKDEIDGIVVLAELADTLLKGVQRG